MKRSATDAFGEPMAAIYDGWYGTRRADESTPQAVEVLAGLAAGGRVLELAVGTGRIALPLAARGLSVHGIDSSEPMVARLREKPGGADLPVTIGDFADVAVDGGFDLIFLVFNTLFNLPAQEDQVRCFQNVARHLTADGVFVVEAFVPDLRGFVDGQAVRVVHTEGDTIVLETSQHDPVAQRVNYRYLELRPSGVEIHPVPMRYAWPSEIDLMARLAGLERRERWGGWDRSAFTASSRTHVSVYSREKERGRDAHDTGGGEHPGRRRRVRRHELPDDEDPLLSSKSRDGAVLGFARMRPRACGHPREGNVRCRPARRCAQQSAR